MKFQDTKGTGPEQIKLQLYNIYYKTALSTFFFTNIYSVFPELLVNRKRTKYIF